MTLGKLFGATAYCWFGGALALVAVYIGVSLRSGAQAGAQHVGELVALGLIAHAVALATSLAVVRRGRGRDRVDAFVFTIAGLIAFNVASEFAGGQGALSRAILEPGTQMAEQAGVTWMGIAFSAPAWSWLSLGVIMLWAVGTAWRLMRVELQAPANPVWYPLFLLAPVVLIGGRTDGLVHGAGVAYLIIHALVLATLLMEPKDFVGWRSLARSMGAARGHAGRHWPATLTGIIMAFIAAVGIALVASLSRDDAATPGGPLVGLAAFAFLLRETAIFAFFHLGARQRRGDFAALVTIALLCIAGPAILAVLKLEALSGAFFVKTDGGSASHLLSIAAGLVEAAIFGVAAQGRWRAREQRLALA